MKKVFTVYDSKAEAYLDPFFMVNSGLAVRGFSELVNTADHQFCKYPSDYTLFELGTYDELHGVFENLRTPLSLGVGIEFKKNSAFPFDNNSK